MLASRQAKNTVKKLLWGVLCLIFGLTIITQLLPAALITERTGGPNDLEGRHRTHKQEDNAAEFRPAMAAGRQRMAAEMATAIEEAAAEMANTPPHHRNKKHPDGASVGDRPRHQPKPKKPKHHKIKESFNLENEFSLFLNKTPGKMAYPKARKSHIGKLDIHGEDVDEAWRIFQNGITKERLYDPNDPAIDRLIHDLQTQRIVAIEEPDAGTQLKLFMDFENGGGALFKPMRFSRELARTGVNQFYFSEFERHNAEIASYHLDRVLGFNRVPPTVGRKFNITSEIQHFADEDFNHTIFVSPGGNKCFHGTCRYYCDTGHAICGNPDMVEGSLQALIPLKDDVPRFTTKSPWRRSYNKHHKASWENDPYYCEDVVPEFGRSRFLLDLIDVHIFDFITGNQDRHHLDTFKVFGNESAPVLFDNGRSFGNPEFDDMVILMPLTQCCIIRHSTLQKLLRFVFGPKKLSEAFIASSVRDAVHPLLTDDFYIAMDRRLVKILRAVRKCVAADSYDDVVLDDGY